MKFDIVTHQFDTLLLLGLEEHHRVLDIGCGTLGLGARLTRFLRPHRYFGVDPQQALIEEGVQFVMGHDLYDSKQPVFGTEVDFGFHRFGVKFDYMIAHALFPDLGIDLIRDCLRGAAANLAPKGVLLASWMPGPMDYGGAGWNPHARAEYRFETLEVIAQEVGLRCRAFTYSHPEGHAWIAFGFDVGEDVAAFLPEVIDGHAGYVEHVQDVGGYVLVSGWSIDPATAIPVDEVLAVDSSGTVCGAIPVKLERRDTAAVHGESALCCGYRGLIKGRAEGLSYFGVVKGRRAYRITVT